MPSELNDFKREGQYEVSSSTETSGNAYCPSLGAVHTAVWDDLGKRNNPVVDLVSSPPLN